MTLEKRAGANGQKYKNSPHFIAAINKYGWDAFEHETLENNLSHDEACLIEQNYIKQYNSRDPDYGYNITHGGEGTSGTKMSEKRKKHLHDIKVGMKLTEEHRRHISESAKTSKKAQENIRKLRDKAYGSTMSEKNRIGIQNALKGKKRSQEARDNMSKALRNRYQTTGERPFIKKPVNQYNQNNELIKQWDSMTSTRQEGFCPSGISACCKGKHKYYRGYIWRYA